MKLYQLVIAYSFIGLATVTALGAWYTKRVRLGLAAGVMAAVGLIIVTIAGHADPPDSNMLADAPAPGDFFSTCPPSLDNKTCIQLFAAAAMGIDAAFSCNKSEKTCISNSGATVDSTITITDSQVNITVENLVQLTCMAETKSAGDSTVSDPPDVYECQFTADGRTLALTGIRMKQDSEVQGVYVQGEMLVIPEMIYFAW